MVEVKKFQRQKFINKLMKSSSTRLSQNDVLSAILRQMSFDGPTSKITKLQIYEETRLHRRTILRCLGELKELGLITVIDNGQGGRSIPPTYQLHIPKSAPHEVDSAPNTGKAAQTPEERAKFADEAMIRAGFRPRKYHG